MHNDTAGPASPDPAARSRGSRPHDAGSGRDGGPGAPVRWRLVGRPAPTLSERLSRLAGLRVLRVPGSRRVFVLAGSMDRLHELAAQPRALVPTSRASLLVAYWRAPRSGWSGGVGALDHLIGQRVSLPRFGRGPASVSVRLARPAPLRDILGAALHAVGPSRPLPAPASPDLTGHGLAPAYLPAAPGTAVRFGELPGSEEIRAHDIVLTGPAAGSVTDPVARAVALDTGWHELRTGGGGHAVLVDARRINPRGRRADAYRPEAPRVRLEIGAGRHWPARGGAAGRPVDGPGLDAATLAALRQVGVVECARVGADAPGATAALLVQVAMTGAVLYAPDVPAPVADLIDPELRGLLGTPVEAAEPLAMEARSVRQRRAAMRGHATAFALPRLTVAEFPTLGRPPTVSAILATRRPEMLARALRVMVDQTYPELEIIVCPHGIELSAELRAMLAAGGRAHQVVAAPAGTSFGEVLGEATRRAGGSLITKFDDDDTYSVEHVWDLVLARHYSGATLVGKGSEFVHLETLGVTVRRPSGTPEADGELVAGGTMLLAKGDLEAVGGWRPVPRSVDLGLIQRLRRDGALIYRTHPLGYVYHRRESGHTWDPGQQYFLDTAFARWDGIPPDAIGDPVAIPAVAEDAVAGRGRIRD